MKTIMILALLVVFFSPLVTVSAEAGQTKHVQKHTRHHGKHFLHHRAGHRRRA